MYLDSANRVCLGVCSGLANWLDIPAAVVRIIFVLGALAWPPMLLGYLVLYFCLDRDFTPGRVRDYFSSAPAAGYFRQLDYRKPIYRNVRDKRIAGVCAGIADYLEVSHFAVRIVTVLSLFVFGPFTFWGYLICWFLLGRDPGLDDPGASGGAPGKRQRRARRRWGRQQRRETARQASKPRKSYRNREFAADSSGTDNAFEQQDEPAIGQAAAGNQATASAASGTTRTRAQCTELYAGLEQRLRKIEAFITSKRFRLHCEINRI